MSNIIEVKHVTKEYRLGTLESVGRRIANRVRRLTGRPVEERPLLKALDDVTFTVAPGEVVGIIGHNGAGKSTLLKILSGVSTPTRGKVVVRGRIAPLIEVGAGFVDNFTGRENLYLNGTILGLSRQQVTAKIDEIVSFAGLEAFIDTPIKHYSSGMKIKLAFGLATSLDAEILVIDEVLAVGDVAFQRKSIQRMEKLINDEGRTVIIVGHNVRQLERICSRMMLLRRGRIEIDGEPGAVSKRFLDETTLGQLSSIQKVDSSLVPIHDSNELQILDIQIDTQEERDGVPVCTLFSDIKVTLSILALHDLNDVELDLGLHTPEMVFILKSSNLLSGVKLDLKPGLHSITVTLPAISLVPGTYGIGLSLFDWARRKLWVGTSLRWLLVETDSATAARLPGSALGFAKAGFDVEFEQEAKLQSPAPAPTSIATVLD